MTRIPIRIIENVIVERGGVKAKICRFLYLFIRSPKLYNVSYSVNNSYGMKVGRAVRYTSDGKMIIRLGGKYGD